MSSDLALDFGTGCTRLADSSGALIFEEPSLAAVSVDSGELVAFGREALGLGARTSARIRLVRPVRAGQLVDLDLAGAVLAQALKRCSVSRAAHPKIVVCAHANATSVQKRAMEKALQAAGARKVSFVEATLACALAAGLAIHDPLGQMVIDVGAGVTDFAVLALGGIAVSMSVPIGGDDFDQAIREHLARQHHLLVDNVALEQIRTHAGSLSRAADGVAEVIGRDTLSGRPGQQRVSHREVQSVLLRISAPIVSGALACITAAPPDLANDLLGSGLVLAGGASTLLGLDRRLATATGVPVHVAADRGRLAVLGASRLIEGAEPRSLVLSGPR